MVIRPATADAVVHEPISTTDWTREGLDEQIEKIERLYRKTLES